MIINKILKLWGYGLVCLFVISCSDNPLSVFTSSQTSYQTPNAAPQTVPTVTPNASSGKFPKNVTLLLPLSGNLAPSGQAVRNGFLSAYYHAPDNLKKVLNVKVVDSSKGDIKNIYQDAVNDGANFIVGPLTKNHVQSLMTWQSLPLPTLALNTVDNYASNSTNNLYQFGLSMRDEIMQLVEKAKAKNFHRAVIITTANAWGRSNASLLKSAWESVGETVVDVLPYSNNSAFDAGIKTVFNVQIAEGEKLPTFRNDVDVIFLLAFPDQARQIRPLLKFYLLDNIPIYATSAIYSGIPQPDIDRDLDGVVFCNMPWTLPNPSLPQSLLDLRQNINDLWTNSYKHYSKLYALGIDAFYLAIGLNKLMENPQRGIAGTTGTLYIDKYNHVYRRLNWVKMQNGQPVVLN